MDSSVLTRVSLRQGLNVSLFQSQSSFESLEIDLKNKMFTPLPEVHYITESTLSILT